MTISDPIADLLTRIRNAVRAKHAYVDVPLSKLKRAVVDVLKKSGFIENVIVDEERHLMRIFLKYNKQSRNPVIRGLKRISRPSVRRYVGYREMPSVLEGLGIAIVSTPKGIMSGDEASKEKVGGELLCSVW